MNLGTSGSYFADNLGGNTAAHIVAGALKGALAANAAQLQAAAAAPAGPSDPQIADDSASAAEGPDPYHHHHHHHHHHEAHYTPVAAPVADSAPAPSDKSVAAANRNQTLLGAMLGAVDAASVGSEAYIKAKIEAAPNDKEGVYNAVMRDFDTELTKVDEAGPKFQKVVDCRTDTLRQVATNYRANAVTHDDAIAQWQAILDRISADLKTAETMGANMASRLREFETASRTLAAVRWDNDAYADFQDDADHLKTQQAQDIQALKKDFANRRREQDREHPKAAERKAAREALDAESKTALADLEAKQQADIARAEAKLAGTIPTSMDASEIQAYNDTTAVEDKSFSAQASVAKSPDSYAASVGDARLSAAP